MTKLEESIEFLYKTFARYPRPAKIQACPCGCTKPGATDCLVAVPLLELRFADLEDYSCSAMTTQGTVEDFRYLLPRLFQGIAEEDYGYNPEILFGKLAYAKWLSWPQDEVTAVRNYFYALWQTALSSFPIQERLPAFFEIETVLASIAHSGEAIELYLSIWTATRTKQADQHLIQFVTMYGADFAGGRTFDAAFWEDAKAQAGALRGWLLREDTLQRIEGAAHLLETDGHEHLFQPALEVLRNEAQSN